MGAMVETVEEGGAVDIMGATVEMVVEEGGAVDIMGATVEVVVEMVVEEGWEEEGEEMAEEEGEEMAEEGVVADEVEMLTFWLLAAAPRKREDATSWGRGIRGMRKEHA